MVKYHKNIAQGTAEWLESRAGKVTASNALILLTKGLGEAMRKNTTTNFKSYWTERGHLLEADALDIYRKVKGADVVQIGFITNDEYPNAGYSPDGFNFTETGLVEVKCFKTEKHMAKYSDLMELPPEVIAQVNFGMMIAEEIWCDLVLYHPPNQEVKPHEAIRIIRLERDERIINSFRERLK